eukprot:CAMPEP_0113972302 /NCGR_PEP_ID=MMETSP0011_2-20120614/13289_1 /TAXON_ID=101924 /ORGANISM="Rhodosorus marinus" /LENGTH=166 /DNA_ID=CAMNT_0000989039 /DNA_START=39 /DNA_END=539 /DNA_ORIENTATION=+ /assembly_acc=CAM_ASM_000156
MAFLSSVVLQPSCIRLEVCARRRRGRVWCTEGADGVHNKDQLGGLSGGNDRRKRNLKRVEPPKLLYLRESDKGDDEYPLVLEVEGSQLFPVFESRTDATKFYRLQRWRTGKKAQLVGKLTDSCCSCASGALGVDPHQSSGALGVDPHQSAHLEAIRSKLEDSFNKS